MNVFITGGYGGIGKDIVEEFEKYNNTVITPSSKELDLSNNESIVTYFSSFKNKKIDIFIHCAGINEPKSFLDLNKEDIDKTLMINVLSCIQIAQIFLPNMIANRFGRIVNISSLWSIKGRPGRTSYSLSKAALDAATRSLAVEYGEYNILINSVQPGFIDTPLTRKNMSAEDLARVIEKTPIKSLVKSKDISKIVYHLCSKDNNAITGQSIVVDGGYTVLG